MVQSLINPDVHHPETDDIDPEDIGHAAKVCEMAFPNSEEDQFMLIALGKVKYTFHDRGLLYYPIYLLTAATTTVQKTKLVAKAKIGIVEVPVKHALLILDEHKDVRLDLLEDPLLFAFANEDYLHQFSTDVVPTATQIPPTDGVADAEPDNVDDAASSSSVQKARQLIAHGIFKTRVTAPSPPDLPEETETESKTLTDTFEQQSETSASLFWVQRFLKNDRYGFHTVHGADADSLFACICDAFQQVGQDTTVAKLRAVVALEATHSVFKSRREAYEHLAVDKTTTTTTDLDRVQQELVGTEFASVTTLQHFREFIMTSRYSPDDWALGVLERKLHAKFIVLSESEFDDGDLHHVIHCFRNSHLKTPDYYIILARNIKGAYVVVTYKNKADHDVGKCIFTVKELPYGLQHKIGQRCSERSGHGFQEIQEFDDLASKHGHDDHRATTNNDLDQDLDHDHDVQLHFYRLASIRAPPGKGPNEHIPMVQQHAFLPLRKVQSWRRKLDDTWAQSKFEVGGKSWASVTHYMQSLKFRKHHSAYADTFSLDSRSALSKNVDLALAATTGSKQRPVKPSQIKVDEEITPEEELQHRVAAVHAKFHQNADLQQLLKATHMATLMHYVPKRGAEPDDVLMALRSTFHQQ
jgi:predicted NAD-dependent protein-ADP-ribosyltransferase YbiA (DUF1768 family)